MSAPLGYGRFALLDLGDTVVIFLPAGFYLRLGCEILIIADVEFSFHRVELLARGVILLPAVFESACGGADAARAHLKPSVCGGVFGQFLAVAGSVLIILSLLGFQFCSGLVVFGLAAVELRVERFGFGYPVAESFIIAAILRKILSRADEASDAADERHKAHYGEHGGYNSA